MLLLYNNIGNSVGVMKTTTQTELPVKQLNKAEDAKAILVETPALQVVEVDGVKELREAAISAQTKQAEAVRSYFDLCEVIRVKQLNSKVVTKELLALGYAKTTVSAVIRVAHTTDEIYLAYKERAIGFKLALSKARELDKPKQSDLPLLSPDESFRIQISEFLEAHIPAAGPLPSFIRPTKEDAGTGLNVCVPVVVHQRKYTLRVALVPVLIGAKKPAKTAKKSKAA